MKPLKPILLFFILLAVQPVLAEDESLSSAQLMNYWGYGAIMLMLVLFLVVLLVLLRTFKVLTMAIMGRKAYADMLAEEKALKMKDKKPKMNVVEKLLSLKPLSEEKSMLIEHDYDGIQELDNPTPAWFMVLFYSTIVFAVAYLLIYHVFGVGQLQNAEYATEMNIAAKERTLYLAKAANRVDESNVKLSTDAAVLTAGEAVFKQTCAPCHGDHAQGVVGPNLTDDYWLHGSKIGDIFKTVKYGITAKGMPTWEKQLTPKQIADVSSYIKSLHGSNPANAKEAQGTKEVDDDAAGAAEKTAMVIKK